MEGKKSNKENQIQPSQRKSRKMTFMEYEEMMHRYAEYFNKYGN